MLEEYVAQLSRAATFSAKGGIGPVVYDAVDRVILDQIRTAVLGEMINKHVDQYFVPSKAAQASGNRLLRTTISLPR